MTDRPVVVYLVRHGRTGLNAAGVLRGHLDPPLDAVGEAEAKALGEIFAPVALAAVVSSPLRRAVQTAGPIAGVTDALLAVDDELIDRDYGPWAGKPHTEVVERFGSLDAAPGVEPVPAFAARAAQAIESIAQRWALAPVAIVAHDAVNRYALAQLVPDLCPPDSIPQDTGCWNRLERTGSVWSAPITGASPHDGRRP
ncbi:MAG: histidine phosphatase family protein [Acidimicrobiales bacterium]